MGTITVSGQLLTFSYAIILGFACSVLYDVFRCLHIKAFRNYWAIFISDILYWILLLFITYSFLLLFCNGIVRFYVLLGEGIGFIICRATFSKIFIKFCFFVLCLVKKTAELVQLPFLALLRFMSNLYEKIPCFIQKIVKNLFQKNKKHLERDTENSV